MIRILFSVDFIPDAMPLLFFEFFEYVFDVVRFLFCRVEKKFHAWQRSHMKFFVESSLKMVQFFFDCLHRIVRFFRRIYTDEYASIAQIGSGVNFCDRDKDTGFQIQFAHQYFRYIALDERVDFSDSFGHISNAKIKMQKSKIKKFKIP